MRVDSKYQKYTCCNKLLPSVANSRTRTALKVLSLVLLNWSGTSEANGSKAGDIEPSCQIPLQVVVHQMEANGQSDKITSGMEMQTKQRCVIEHVQVKKMQPQHLLMFAESLWRSATECEHSEMLSGCFSSGDNNNVMSMVCRFLFIAGENA